jgi:hypothetical protein
MKQRLAQPANSHGFIGLCAEEKALLHLVGRYATDD